MEKSNIKISDYGRHLLDELDTPPTQHTSFMSDTKDVHIRIINQIVEVIQSQSKSEGTASWSIIWLVGRSTNALNCAFHLAQHGYMSQAYSLLRSVCESLDLIQLFKKNPAEADEWTEENSAKLRQRFAPKAVRGRLGRSQTDELYSFFCGQGSHPRFEGRHISSHIEIDPKTHNKKIKFILGGSHRIKDLYSTHLFGVLLGQLLLIEIWQFFGSKVPNIISSRALQVQDFFAQYLEAHLQKMTTDVFKDDPVVKEHVNEWVTGLKNCFVGIPDFAKEMASL